MNLESRATTRSAATLLSDMFKIWRHIITRLGRWVDFDDDYKTMDVDFMESVWWVVKELWTKNLFTAVIKSCLFPLGWNAVIEF